MAEFDHIGWMQNEDNWPQWPFLPLRKSRPGQVPDVGVLVSGGGPDVYLKNLFDGKELDEVEKIDFPDYLAVYDAGWRVD